MVFNLMSHNIVANNVRDIVPEFWKLYFMIKPPFKIRIFSKKRVYTKYEFYEQAVRIYLMAKSCRKNYRGGTDQWKIFNGIKDFAKIIMNRFDVGSQSTELPSPSDIGLAIDKVNGIMAPIRIL